MSLTFHGTMNVQLAHFCMNNSIVRECVCELECDGIFLYHYNLMIMAEVGYIDLQYCHAI